jgi:peptidoglycan/LPS O-acetylase OafA/YrhL
MNGPSWSISDEVIAYLIFPLPLALVFHRGVRTCVAAALISAAILFAMASFQPHLGMDPVNLGLYADIPRCLCEFVLGLCAFRLYNSPRSPRSLASDRALATIVAAIAAIVLLRIGEFFAVMLFPFLIVAIAHNRGIGRKLFEHPLPHFMGLISYSLYLIHDPLRPLALILVKALHPQPLSAVGGIAFAVAGSLSVILPAWVTFRCVEGPGRDAFRRFFRRFGAKPAPIAVTAE